LGKFFIAFDKRPVTSFPEKNNHDQNSKEKIMNKRHLLLGSQEFKSLPFQSSLLSSENITDEQYQTTEHNLPTRYDELSITKLQINRTETPETCLYPFRQF
jgi:hypothetical protein